MGSLTRLNTTGIDFVCRPDLLKRGIAGGEDHATEAWVTLSARMGRAAADIERHCRAGELNEPRRLRHSTPLRPLSYIDAIIDSDASPGIDG